MDTYETLQNLKKEVQKFDQMLLDLNRNTVWTKENWNELSNKEDLLDQVTSSFYKIINELEHELSKETDVDIFYVYGK
jgi:DNA phosphorothioation-dependent restriction protein DptG